MKSSRESKTESVCVVDDDPNVLTSIRRLLSSDGLAVLPFSEPQKFLSHAKAHPVPLVVLDVWMKEMNGLEVQSKLAQISPDTRVIVMTGRKDSGVEQRAIEAGAAAFFTKPFDDEKFVAAVRDVLGLLP